MTAKRRKPSPVGLHRTSHGDSGQPDRSLVLQSVGLNGFSDAVPAVCALKSRAPCLIGEAYRPAPICLVSSA
jgi:hypothetical protein